MISSELAFPISVYLVKDASLDMYWLYEEIKDLGAQTKFHAQGCSRILSPSKESLNNEDRALKSRIDYAQNWQEKFVIQAVITHPPHNFEIYPTQTTCPT